MTAKTLKEKILKIIYGAKWYFECVDNGGYRGSDLAVSKFNIEEDNVDETVEAIVEEVLKERCVM